MNAIIDQLHIVSYYFAELKHFAIKQQQFLLPQQNISSVSPK